VAVVLDLDGVVWLVDRPIAGSPEAVARLRAAGQRVWFLTNNSNPTLETLIAKLAGMGIPAESADVLSSAATAASLLTPGSSVLVCAGDGVREALAARGVWEVEFGGSAGAGAVGVVPDAVVVGLTMAFDYAQLRAASTAIRRGARFIATNDDATYPTPDGPIPGSGSLVAAVRTASGKEPEIAGKPYPPTVERIWRETGGAELVVVGDRPDTDGLLARRLGARFALVLTGVTRPGDLPVDPAPDVVAADLAEAVGGLIGS
jgi:HAD superfamily hydrolase (TIGR01450 family)